MNAGAFLRYSIIGSNRNFIEGCNQQTPTITYMPGGRSFTWHPYPSIIKESNQPDFSIENIIPRIENEPEIITIIETGLSDEALADISS